VVPPKFSAQANGKVLVKNKTPIPHGTRVTRVATQIALRPSLVTLYRALPGGFVTRISGAELAARCCLLASSGGFLKALLLLFLHHRVAVINL